MDVWALKEEVARVEDFRWEWGNKRHRLPVDFSDISKEFGGKGMEGIRYAKQCYGLEDIRLLSYARLRNMAALVLATAYFASTWIGRSLRREILARNIARLPKRLYGVAEFCYYALADGIATLCKRYGRWKGMGAPDATPDPQLRLPLFDSILKNGESPPPPLLTEGGS